jgi:Epoxide hydrolase N terminus
VNASTYHIDVSDGAIGDLRDRLARTRWPDQPDDAGWQWGTNLEYLKELAQYWRTHFDWRAQERLLNSLPNFRSSVAGIGLHFIHVRGTGPNPFPLLLTHGWPSTFYEFMKMIPFLADPEAHGADPVDAFDVVVPSLPGYGFSDKPPAGNVFARVPKLWVRLMDGLGYERFGVQGGDLGAERLGTPWHGTP